MKTIVTGGAGFIGSHLVKKLIEEGREVIVIDDFSSGSMENLLDLGLKSSDFELQKLDLTNYHQTLEAFKDTDSVFHLAARIGGIKYLHGSKSIELQSLQKNLSIDSNVFQACVEKKVKKIIYTSSSAIYPLDKQFSLGTVFSENDFSLMSENENSKFHFRISMNPDGGYGLAKLLSEIQLNLMKNVQIGIVRIFNVYGVNEPLDERAHAISDLIRKAMNYPKEEFIVWGDGKQTRDYVYISDCIDALVKLEEKISDYSHLPLIVNVGSGRGLSLREIAEEIIKISGKDIKPIYDSTKPAGPISRTANANKIKSLLNWQPKITLNEGLKRSYFWIQKKIT